MHVAGQKSESLTRFDSRSDEDDLADLILTQRIHGHRDREIGLARTGWANAERQIILANRFDVLELARRTRMNSAGSVEDVDATVGRFGFRAVRFRAWPAANNDSVVRLWRRSRETHAES